MDGLTEHLELIAGHKLFRGLSREEICDILSCLNGRVLAFRAGDSLDELVRSGPAQTLGCVLSGWGQLYKYDFWGNQSILDFMMPNYVMGFYRTFFNVTQTELHAVATEPGLLLLLEASLLTDPPKEEYYPLLAKLGKNLAAVLAERSWRLLKKLDILSAGSLREKILLYLSYEAEFFGSTTFEIPFDRQGLADYLYTDRSSLSRELGRLKAEGWIDFTRSRFTLHPPKK